MLRKLKSIKEKKQGYLRGNDELLIQLISSRKNNIKKKITKVV